MHGGKSNGSPNNPGNKFAKKFGIYESGLHDDEKTQYLEIEIGNLEHEIRMCKIQLKRALNAKKLFENGMDAPIIEEHLEGKTDGDGKLKPKSIKKIKRHPDYSAIVDRFLGRIANLEKTQMELKRIKLEISVGLPEQPGKAANDFFEALKKIEETDGGTYKPVG